MRIIDLLKGGHYCTGCGDCYPISVMISFNGCGKYCTECAKEIIEDEMEE
jgi:hypothetical protein